MRKKSILLIHKYYWPDTPPYASILRKIAEELKDSNFEVEIFSSVPSYRNSRIKKDIRPGIDNRATIKVFRSKQPFLNEKAKFFEIMNMLIFSFQAFFYVFRAKHFDTVMMSTCPPVLGSLLVSLACKLKKFNFYYHVCDVQPEVGLISKDFANPLIFNVLRILDTFTCLMSKKIIVMSLDMKNSLLLRGHIDKNKIHIIQNLSLPIFSKSKKNIRNNKIRNDNNQKVLQVIFAGNIGRFQDLENLIHAFNSVELSRIKLFIIGEGKELKRLKSIKLKYRNIFFKGWLSPIKTEEYLMNSDIAVVSLKNNVINYAYPSKTITYIKNGIPIASIVEKTSELAKLLIKERIGFNIPENNVNAIKNSFIKWGNSPSFQNDLKKEALKKKDKIFNTTKIIKSWVSLFN